MASGGLGPDTGYDELEVNDGGRGFQQIFTVATADNSREENIFKD